MHRFDGGGAERMTVILANELYKRGYEVTFCVREDAGETRVLLQENIPVLDMKLMQAGKLYRNLKNISVLRKLLRSREFDLMLSITTEMSSKNLLQAHLPRISDLLTLISVYPQIVLFSITKS